MKNLTETQLKGEILFAGRIIHLHRDSVLLPNGQESIREIVKVPPAVAVVAIQAQDLLLVRQYRYALGQTVLEIPAGRLDPQEAPAAGAERELREETGFRTNLEPLGSFLMSVGYSDEMIHFFLGKDLVWDPLPLDAGEFLEVERIPWSEAVILAQQGKFPDGKTALGILLAHGVSD